MKLLWLSRGVATLALCLCALVLPATAMAGPTYYVDAANGDDAYSDLAAQNPATPWKTIKKAVDTGGLLGVSRKGVPLDGYTVVVQPGVYNESVESKRDGLPGNPVILRAASPGTVTIRPPAGRNGFFVSHHHHVVEGFIVTGATIGLKMGPHDGGDGPTAGLVARRNQVSGNTNNGIQFTQAVEGIVEFNTVSQNGQNGISYSGSGGTIHDNVVQANAQFGLYVKDGIDHRVWNNVVENNGKGDVKIEGSLLPPPGGRTFYVSVSTGSDSRNEVQAQTPATPWQTVRKALQTANAGDIVAVLPGTYTASVESIRDGTATAPITLRAVNPGTVTIQPPAGSSGVYIAHHYHIVEGLLITGAATGLQMGPYKNTGAAVVGLTARGNVLLANGIGIKFTNATDGTAAHNIVRDSARDGIQYNGNGATIFNNLIVGNGRSLTGDFALVLATGDRHQIINNTVFGNLNGGIRLATSNSVPVFSTVLNNIVVQNPVGVREPAGSDYVGRAVLDYNDVYGNTSDYALSKGSGSKPGSSSLSLPPVFVDPMTTDFRLGRKATGQTADSPLIDKGSDTAEAVGLGGRTAFTDKYPDKGRVDLGYHETLLHLAEGTPTVNQAAIVLDGSGERFTVSANLRLGAKSDGVVLGTDFVLVTFGGFPLFLPAIGFQRQGSGWLYSGGEQVSQATLEDLGDGSVNVTLQTTGFAVETAIATTTGIAVQIGDDFAATSISLKGTLSFP